MQSDEGRGCAGRFNPVAVFENETRIRPQRFLDGLQSRNVRMSTESWSTAWEE